WPCGLPGSVHLLSANGSHIGLCSSVKVCKVGENLLSVSDLRSGSQERLTDADALICPPPLQSRTVPSVHPYTPVERSAPSVSPLSEPQRRSLGHLPRPAGPETLPL